MFYFLSIICLVRILIKEYFSSFFKNVYNGILNCNHLFIYLNKYLVIVSQHYDVNASSSCSARVQIHDALSFGGPDGDADRKLHELQQGAAANTLLYVGLCSVALGLIIAFVGTGEKGFKTVQLRFIGPGMIAIGACCCAVRIMLCFCPPAFCFKRRRHKGGVGDKMAEFYKYMPFRNHPLNATAAAEPLTGNDAAAAAEAVPMSVLKPALKRVPLASDHLLQQRQIVVGQQVSAAHFVVQPV